MKRLSKRALVSLGLGALFLAGVGTGATLTWGRGNPRDLTPPSSKRMCAYLKERFERELQLTPPQVRKLEPLLAKRVQEIQAVHGDAVKRIEAIIRASNEELAQVLELTPEQRQRLASCEEKRWETMKSRGGGKRRDHGRDSASKQ